MSTLADLFPSWQQRARCVGYGVDHWFPTRGESTTVAKAICGGCMVRDECLEFALTESIEHGVWGGMSGRERQRERRRRAEGGGRYPTTVVKAPLRHSADLPPEVSNTQTGGVL